MQLHHARNARQAAGAGITIEPVTGGQIEMEDDVVPLDTGPIIPPDPTPPPVGQPFQIKSVALTSGYRTKDQFKIVWNVWGDESEIDHYYVYLFVVRPEMLPAA